MEKFSRSKSTRENPGVYPSSMQDLRSCSSTSGYNPNQNREYPIGDFKDTKIKKVNNCSKSSKIASSSSAKNWNFSMDPELQRKKRVASYKAYAVEGKMKSSLRKSFRWMKNVVHGLW